MNAPRQRCRTRLVALGKAGQTLPLAQRVHALAAAGQHLVDSTDGRRPHQPVVRRVVTVVQGDGQLDDAQV